MIPVLFSFGAVTIYSFGFAVAIGILSAIFLMSRRLRRSSLFLPEMASDILLICAAAGFLGARIYYVIQHWALYTDRPWTAFAVWEGGLTFYGGVPSAVAALILFFRWKKKPVLEGLDLVATYVAWVQAFGRLGCFLNGCCFGKSCSLPWAVSFPQGPYGVHPAQLYEVGLLFLLFAGLSSLEQKKHLPGQVLAMYFAGYGILRFFVEIFRETEVQSVFLTVNQQISLGLILAGFSMNFWLKLNKREFNRGG